MSARLDFYVKCYRCRTMAEATYGQSSVPAAPLGWQAVGVPPEWAFGGIPDDVLLCRMCRDRVNATMQAAWGKAIAHPPEEAAP